MTSDRAERLCRDEMELADGVAGPVGIGLGSGGATLRGSITVTDRVFAPRPPEAYMADCMARRRDGRPQPTQVGVTLGDST